MHTDHPVFQPNVAQLQEEAVRLPRSTIRRLYAFALIAGLGLGIVIFGFLRVVAPFPATSTTHLLLLALFIGLLIGLTMCIVVKLTLRQAAYDLYNHLDDVSGEIAAPPSASPFGDEMVYLRDIVEQVIAAIPRPDAFPRLAQDLLVAGDLKAALIVTATHLNKHMPLQGALLLLLDKERNLLYAASACGQIVFDPELTLDAEHSAIGRALAEQRPLVYTNGAAYDSKLIDASSTLETLYCLPLAAASGPIGVLGLAYNYGATRLNEEQREFARGASDLLTLAVQRYIFRQQVQRERLIADSFERLAALMDADITVNLALERVVRLAGQMTECDHATLMLLDTDQQVHRRISLQGGQMIPLSLVAPTILRNGLAGWVMRERRSDLILDTERDTRWLPLPGQPPMRSALVAPLLHGDAVLGVLTLADPRPSHFSRRSLALMNAVAACAALIIARREERAVVDEHLLMVRHAFAARLTPDMLRDLLADQPTVSRLITPHSWEAVALTVELSGLDRINGSLPDEQRLEAIYTPFQEAALAAVLQHQGCIERSAESSLLAFFSFPLGQHDAESRAIRAARAIQQALRRLRVQWRTSTGYDVHFSIGIARGRIIGGIVPVGAAYQCPMFGDAIEQARLLQRLARPGEILLDANAISSLHHDSSLRLELLGPLPVAEGRRGGQIYRLQSTGAQSHFNVGTHGLPIV
ncbi:GAF domain-containing protein [Candidatus Gracilibacteria bacterium]|nr:GAF domain-containing protein [Candidatus Gracilibacteria bacterium]